MACDSTGTVCTKCYKSDFRDKGQDCDTTFSKVCETSVWTADSTTGASFCSSCQVAGQMPNTATAKTCKAATTPITDCLIMGADTSTCLKCTEPKIVALTTPNACIDQPADIVTLDNCKTMAVSKASGNTESDRKCTVCNEGYALKTDGTCVADETGCATYDASSKCTSCFVGIGSYANGYKDGAVTCKYTASKTTASTNSPDPTPTPSSNGSLKMLGFLGGAIFALGIQLS